MDWSSYLFEGPADSFVYEGDRLQVQLELEVYQHNRC